jgi:hypothetical protein
MEPRPKKLLDRVRDAIRVKNYALRTENTYVDWIERFIRFHGLRHPLEMNTPEIEHERVLPGGCGQTTFLTKQRPSGRKALNTRAVQPGQHHAMFGFPVVGYDRQTLLRLVRS